jgi:Ca2+-binding RTX toxin-like protein
MTYQAASDQVNDVFIERFAGTTYRVTDTAGVVAGANCAPVNATSATCNNVTSITANLRDRADKVEVETFGFTTPATLNGGGGNDALTGDDGDDTLNGDGGRDFLNGRTGVDAFFGGAGNDFLVTEDGIQDGTISCGGGDRDHAQVDGAEGGPVTGCEIISE